MNPDGTSQRVLTRGLDAAGSQWSPDGATLAFEVYVSVEPRTFDLFLMARDGSSPRNLTNTKSPIEFDPRWSPDGRMIAFVSRTHPDSDIHLIRTNGKRHVKLARSPKYDAEHDWSADGRSIAFASTRDGNRDIYLMTAAGRNQVNLTNDDVGTRNANPAWSP